MAAGLSTTGLTIKTVSEILTEINDDQKASATLGADWDTSTTSPQGVMNGIMAERIGECWQVLAAVYNQGYPDGAEGVQADRIGEFTGAVRLPATSSTVKVVCYGTALTSLVAGRVLSVDGGERFQSLDDATIETADAWAAATNYEQYDIVTNDSGKLYVCTSDGGGTSAGSGGPTGTSTSEVTDNTASWKYVATATAGVVVDFESEETGPVVANALTLTQIETSVGGWDGAANPLDAEPGRDLEEDADFKARRSQSLRIQGASAVDAIRADILDVADVTTCIVFDNPTSEEDGDGLPPNSVEVLVQGGEDQDIWDALLTTVAAGTETYGSEVGTATDASGTVRAMSFTRPTEVEPYITVDLTVLSTEWPADGEDQVKAALVEFGDDLEIGDDVVRSQLFSPCRTVSGVYDVTQIYLGFTISPVGTSNLTTTARERAVIDSSRIVVNVTEI